MTFNDFVTMIHACCPGYNIVRKDDCLICDVCVFFIVNRRFVTMIHACCPGYNIVRKDDCLICDVCVFFIVNETNVTIAAEISPRKPVNSNQPGILSVTMGPSVAWVPQ